MNFALQTRILKALGIAFLLMFAGQISADIVGSKHDLTPGGTGQDQSTTDQVCVFCHTPHGSATDAPVPLWNKVLGTPSSYTQYSTLQLPSFEAEEAPVGSVSLACLSCHDGTQAMDVVLNLPGSGGYNATGAEIDAGTVSNMTGTPIPNLGTDLTNDHPISMQYAAGGAVAADPDGTAPGPFGDADFTAPEKDTINTNPIWWVDSAPGTTAVREKTDMILYARNEFGVVEPFVECGSCHDPHNQASGGAADQVEFLRVANTASQICTACHIK